MYRRILIALAIAAALGSGLFAAAGGEAREGALPLEAGALAEVDLSRGEAVYAFTAPSGSVYGVWLFPVESPGDVRCELWQGGKLLAEGEGTMPALSLRLKSGAEYELRLSGEGRVRLEVARQALSRCYGMPMVLDTRGDAYSKAIVRPGDVHWYALDADSDAPLALVGAPAEEGLRLAAALFDDEGRLLAEGMPTAGGACLMDLTPRPGRRCLVRITSAEGETGLYNLRLSRLDGELPDRVTLSRHALRLRGRSAARLEAWLSPEDAGGALYWESADPAVADVNANGVVTGRGVGTTLITAYGAGGESDSCAVEVSYVPVSGVALLAGRMALRAGDDAAIECEVLPGNASDPRLVYEAEPDGIVEIDRGGVLRGLVEGECTVTVRTLDGGLRDEMTVRVGPAPRRWRALLVGEQNYAATVAAVRTGSVNSVTAVRSLLESLSFSGSKCQVSTLLDASRDGVLAAVAGTFGEAGDGDLSLFYITCHGEYAGGMTCFQMYDGSVLSAAELAEALRGVRGEVLVVVDCCGSGGVIGRASGTGDILKGIVDVFQGAVGPAPMQSSRFRVLASAALEQDSYRLGFEGGEAGMATVFARALCEAGGWSIDRAERGAMRADADYDGRVTLGELYLYTARRVMWYLNLAGGGQYAQSVQVWPEGDGWVAFER